MSERILKSPMAKVGIAVACGIILVFFVFTNWNSDSKPQSSNQTEVVEELNHSTHELLTSSNMSGEGKIVGGLGAVREKNDEVQEVVDKIMPVLSEKTGKKFVSIEVLSYKHQTVAGSNFFVKGKAKTDTGEEDIVHLRIYRNISQELELTAYELGKKLEEEIKYFQ